MSNRITIKTIARDLGVSHMTVSRALSHHPSVQKETGDRIRKRAHELGYVKSAAATVMRGNSTRIVGLLLPNITNEFYARFANSMAKACESQSLQLIIHLTDDDRELEHNALARLREVQARAVVMVPSPGDPVGETRQSGNMKVIELIRQRANKGEYATILVDDRQAIRDAVVHLADNGHRSIAYIGANSELSSGRARLSAYLWGLEDAGLDAEDDLIFTNSPSFGTGRDAAQMILNQQKSTALICGGFEIANGALSALMARDINLKKDFSFVGYGDPSFYSWVAGGISTIRVPVTDLARQAAALVDLDAPLSKLGAAETRKFPATFVAR